MNNDVNESLSIDPKKIIPLVGLDALPPGFRFSVRMFPFGGMRCRVSIPAECLAECFDALGVGQCRLLIHEAIYSQLHLKQMDIGFADIEDLPVLIEVFSKYRCKWQHFDEPVLTDHKADLSWV